MVGKATRHDSNRLAEHLEALRYVQDYLRHFEAEEESPGTLEDWIDDFDAWLVDLLDQESGRLKCAVDALQKFYPPRVMRSGKISYALPEEAREIWCKLCNAGRRPCSTMEKREQRRDDVRDAARALFDWAAAERDRLKGPGPSAEPNGIQPTSNPVRREPREAQAIAYFLHEVRKGRKASDIKKAEIAKAIGCHVKTLSKRKAPDLTAIIAAHRAITTTTIPRGMMADGTIEAIGDEDLDFDAMDDR